MGEEQILTEKVRLEVPSLIAALKFPEDLHEIRFSVLRGKGEDRYTSQRIPLSGGNMTLRITPGGAIHMEFRARRGRWRTDELQTAIGATNVWGENPSIQLSLWRNVKGSEARGGILSNHMPTRQFHPESETQLRWHVLETVRRVCTAEIKIRGNNIPERNRLVESIQRKS